MAQPHFIVFANEKGGTGKSTTAVHTAVALAATGHVVGALDLDSRQRTMTRYLENRDATMRRLGKNLPQAKYRVFEGDSVEGLELALRELAEDVDVIVVDHHKCSPELPRAAALVNPNRLDENDLAAAHGHLAAVGVAFLLAIALVRTLRARGHFENRKEPDLFALLDLVAQYQTIKDEVLAAMMSVIERQGFIMGPEVAQLENAVAQLSHSKHAIGCASGTDALLLFGRLDRP